MAITIQGAAGRDFGIVTALPSGASVGDFCTFKAATGTYWRLVYTGEATYPWAKIGGPPLTSPTIQAQEGTTSTAWTDLATFGPSVTVPIDGDYRVTVEANLQKVKGSNSVLAAPSYDGGEPPADGHIVIFTSSERIETQLGRTCRIDGCVAGKAIRVRYRVSAAGNELLADTRRIEIDPIRVG